MPGKSRVTLEKESHFGARNTFWILQEQNVTSARHATLLRPDVVGYPLKR